MSRYGRKRRKSVAARIRRLAVRERLNGNTSGAERLKRWAEEVAAAEQEQRWEHSEFGRIRRRYIN